MLRADGDAVYSLVKGNFYDVNTIAVVGNTSIDRMSIATASLGIWVVLAEVFSSPRELNQSDTTRLGNLLKSEIYVIILFGIIPREDGDEVWYIRIVFMLVIGLGIGPFPIHL